LIINNSTTLVNASNVGTTNAFAIKASAKAFQILSSGLYSDKVTAVLREYGCNASDAHVAAGKADVPFDVKLPTSLDDTFYIRDYGNGLNSSDVVELFCTYFGSDKTDSNALIGGFGLGSKSAYSYTDRFTIRSAHSGIVTTYIAYLGPEGAPVVSQVGSEPVTDWPSGIEISFAVPPKDVREFNTKAEWVFSCFATPVRVNGELVVPRLTASELPSMLVASQGGLQSRGYVRVGNVMYPTYNHNNEFLRTSDGYNYLINKGYIAELPIGSVDIAASREALEFTNRTVDTLRQAFDVAYAHLCDLLGEQLKVPLPTTLAGLLAWRNELATINNADWNLVLQIAKSRGFYDRYVMYKPANNSISVTQSTPTFSRVALDIEWHASMTLNPDGTVKYDLNVRKVKPSLGPYSSWNGSVVFYNDKHLTSVVIVVDDFVKRDMKVSTYHATARKRAVALAEARGVGTKVLVVSPEPSTRIANGDVVTEVPAVDAVVAELKLEAILDVEVIKASELPKVKAKKKDPQAPKQPRVVKTWQQREIPAVVLGRNIGRRIRFQDLTPVEQGTLPAGDTFWVQRTCIYGNHRTSIVAGSTVQWIVDAMHNVQNIQQTIPSCIKLPGALIVATATEMMSAKMEEAVGFRPLHDWIEEQNAAVSNYINSQLPTTQMQYTLLEDMSYSVYGGECSVRWLLKFWADKSHPNHASASAIVEAWPGMKDFFNFLMTLPKAPPTNASAMYEQFLVWTRRFDLELPSGVNSEAIDPDKACLDWQRANANELRYVSLENNDAIPEKVWGAVLSLLAQPTVQLSAAA
jgi:hypothetical protein